jgi:hypothetical protein
LGGAVNACATGCSAEQAAQGILVGAAVGGVVGGTASAVTSPAAGIAVEAPRTAAVAWQPVPSQSAAVASTVAVTAVGNIEEEAVNQAATYWQGTGSDGSGEYQCTGPVQDTPISSPSCSPIR